MSQYPQTIDVFTNKTGADNIASSDPNNAFDGIEATQGLIGALGEPQTWSTTLITLLRKYRRDMRVEATGGILYVRLGEAVLENTAGNKFAFRRNSADVTLAAGNLDVGSMAVGTYYVYAIAPSAATTAPIQFSTDANAPSGIGTAPYSRLGWFYNAVAAILAPTYAHDRDDSKTSFGIWVDGFVKGTTYQAATDGLVSAHGDQNGQIDGFTDSSNPPTTKRTFGGDAAGGGLCMPVRKGDYWKVNFPSAQPSVYAIYWLPLGL